MNGSISTDVVHCWNRLHELADWALQTQTDPRERAAKVVQSLVAHGDQADIDQLRNIVGTELAAEEGRQVSLPALQRHSVWLSVLSAAKAALRT